MTFTAKIFSPVGVSEIVVSCLILVSPKMKLHVSMTLVEILLIYEKEREKMANELYSKRLQVISGLSN